MVAARALTEEDTNQQAEMGVVTNLHVTREVIVLVPVVVEGR